MPISRRQFLKLTGLGLVVVGSRYMPGLETEAFAQSRLPAGAELGELGRRQRAGFVSLDLRAAPTRVEVAGRPAELWTYNQQFPGPTLRLWEGDQVRLRFSNGLPEATNLHFHGLHIPPTGNADNVFREVAPGQTALYEFTVPEGSAGTYWYHPHIHGTVSSQMFRGLAGAIVVEGALDEAFRNLPEQLLVLKDIEFRANGEIADHDTMDWAMGREGSLLTVNGSEMPTLDVPGGAVRLRLLNAANARYYLLRLPQAAMTVIASDGGFVASPYRVEELLLAPGERYEVVANFPARGSFDLVTLPYDRSQEEGMAGMAAAGGMANKPGHGMGGMPGGMSVRGGTSNEVLPASVALVRFTAGAAGTFDVPEALADIEPLQPTSATASRRIELGEEMAAARFFIGGRVFDPARVDMSVQLGSVERWEIVNGTAMDHPMHLHVHPFQVLSSNGVNLRHLMWKDVVNVPANGRVEIMVPFRNFVGKTVFHCHIVEHEDRGMMSVLEVT